MPYRINKEATMSTPSSVLQIDKSGKETVPHKTVEGIFLTLENNSQSFLIRLRHCDPISIPYREWSKDTITACTVFCYRKWCKKLNISKSVHVDIASWHVLCTSVYMHEIRVPSSNMVKFLCMTLDAKLQWNEYVKIKTVEVRLR